MATDPSPTAPLSRTTKHVMDAEGRWTTEQRFIWRDASGWHDIPARDELTYSNERNLHDEHRAR